MPLCPKAHLGVGDSTPTPPLLTLFQTLGSQGPMPGSPWAEQGAASSGETGSQDVLSSREQGGPFVPHNPLPALAPSLLATSV
jgi:hypothetical protein